MVSPYKTLFFFFYLLIFCSFTSGDNRSQYNVPLGAYTVCAGDIDLDGDIDIMVGHNVINNWSGISYLINTNNGYFTLTDSLFFFGWQYVKIGQLDNNPYPEIIFKKENSSTEFIGIIFNNNFGDSIFLDTHSYNGISYIATGDIDNNGFNDIIFASNNGQFFGVFYNFDNKNFSLPEFHYLTGTYPTGLTCGDLNNDGRNDIIVFGAKVEVYYSLASGLQEVLLCEHQTDGFIEDFNHDGKKDIICFDDLAMIGLTGVTMFENTGSGNFIKHDEIVFPFSTSEFLLSDFDNDSLPDILFRLMNKSGYIIYNNQGGFQLGDSAFVPVVDYGEHWRNSFCADLDGNGYNDVITIRTSGVVLPANLDIKFNDGKGHFVDHPLGIKNKVNEIQPFKCFPNPFCDQTLFEFNLSTTELVNLSIYDVGGKLVTCLIDEKLEAGKYNVAWKRNDLNKKPCDPGLYFAILKLNGEPKRILKLVIY